MTLEEVALDRPPMGGTPDADVRHVMLKAL